jgi:hypothetical protein
MACRASPSVRSQILEKSILRRVRRSPGVQIPEPAVWIREFLKPRHNLIGALRDGQHRARSKHESDGGKEDHTMVATKLGMA